MRAHLQVSLLAFISAASSQLTSFTTLAGPSRYIDGNFVSPSPSTQIFNQGSVLNVSWTSKYSIVNLYLIVNEDYASPITLIAYTSVTSFEWSVDDGGNNTHVFNFRVVDAEGDDSAQMSGGFASARFWIQDPILVAGLSSAARSATLTSSTSGLATSIATISSLAATDLVGTMAIPLSTSRGFIPSAPSATTTFVTATSDLVPSSSVTAVTMESAPPSISSAIGAGLGVGIGVVALAVAVYLLICFMRMRKHKQRQPAFFPTYEPASRYDQSSLWSSQHSEAPNFSKPLPLMRAPVQAFCLPTEPQELAAYRMSVLSNAAQ